MKNNAEMKFRIYPSRHPERFTLEHYETIMSTRKEFAPRKRKGLDRLFKWKSSEIVTLIVYETYDYKTISAQDNLPIEREFHNGFFEERKLVKEDFYKSEEAARAGAASYKEMIEKTLPEPINFEL